MEIGLIIEYKKSLDALYDVQRIQGLYDYQQEFIDGDGLFVA